MVSPVLQKVSISQNYLSVTCTYVHTHTLFTQSTSTSPIPVFYKEQSLMLN